MRASTEEPQKDSVEDQLGGGRVDVLNAMMI
jgi:hypothetical protein